VKIISKIEYIPRKVELVLVYDTNRLGAAELHHWTLMKPKSMHFSSYPLNYFISRDGFFLFVFSNTCKIFKSKGRR